MKYYSQKYKQPFYGVFKLYSGGTPPRSNTDYWTDGDIRWISSKHISTSGSIDNWEIINKKAVNDSKTKIAPKNSFILVTRVSLGKSALLDHNFAINQDITALIPKLTTNQNFMRYQLMVISDNCIKQGRGASVKGITRDYLKKIDVWLPPKKEQKRIANKIEKLFNETDRSIEKLNESKMLLDSLLISYLSKVLNNVAFDTNKTLGDLIDYKNGLWKGKKDPMKKAQVVRSTEFNDDGSCNLNTAKEIDVEEKQFKEKRLKYGHILLERSGGGANKPVGRVVYLGKDVERGDYSFSNFTTCLMPNTKIVFPEYLFHYLHFFYLSGETNNYQKAIIGIRNLEFQNYLGINIPIPNSGMKNSISIQKKISSEIYRVKDYIKNANLKHSDELNYFNNLKQSILNQAFQGNL